MGNDEKIGSCGTPANERLASVEAQLEFIKDLIQEIRDEVKNQPSREEFNKIQEEVEFLRKTVGNLAIKVAMASTILSMLGGSLIKYILQ